MGFYDEMADIATDLLTEFNQATFVLVQSVAGGGPAYNPGSAAPNERTFAGGTVRGVSQKYIDGKEIIASDLQASLSVAQTGHADSIRPTVKDKLSINGKLYNIIADKTVPAAGVPVAYIVIIRK